MVRRKTLLVLGAGASHPYGLPLGSELTDSLCVWAWQPPDPNAQVVKLIEDCDVTREDLLLFCRAFHRSMIPSVDAFLAHRPVMAAVGKLAIAYLLGTQEYEQDDRWFVRNDH